MRYIVSLFACFLCFAGFVEAATRVELLSECQIAVDAMDDCMAACSSRRVRESYESAEGYSGGQSYDAFLARYKQSHAETQDQMARVVDMLADEETPIEDVLGELLGLRLRDLCDRTKQLHKYFGERNRDDLIIPTIDLFYRGVTVQDEANMALRRDAYLRHEVVEHMICMAFRASHPTNIQGQTLEYLKMSPQLWPLLANETKKANVIDECGGYAPLAFLWRAVPKAMREKGNMAYVVAEHIWPAYQDPQKLRALFEGDDQAIAAYKEFRQRCDGEVYKAFNVPTPVEFPVDGTLGTPNKARVWEDVLEGEYWPALKMPPFLVKMLKEAEGSADLAPLPESGLFAADAVASEPKKKLKGHPTLKKGKAPLKKKQQALPQKPGEITGATGELEEASTSPALPLEAEEQSRLKEREAGESDHVAPSAASALSDNPQAAAADPKKNEACDDAGRPRTKVVEDTFVYPQALRTKFVLRQALPAREMPEIQKFLRVLFDPSACCSLTFQDVAVAWQRIGGRIEGEKSGGSHRVFIGPDGTKLWGTYDHGGFGAKTIKYVQAAFHWAGARESAGALL